MELCRVNASIFQWSKVQSHYFSGTVLQALLLDETRCWICCQTDSTSCRYHRRINLTDALEEVSCMTKWFDNKITTHVLCERDQREDGFRNQQNWQKRPSRFKTYFRRCSVELWIGCKSWTFNFCNCMQRFSGEHRIVFQKTFVGLRTLNIQTWTWKTLKQAVNWISCDEKPNYPLNSEVYKLHIVWLENNWSSVLLMTRRNTWSLFERKLQGMLLVWYQCWLFWSL